MAWRNPYLGAFWKGRSARRRGRPIDSCPYSNTIPRDRHGRSRATFSRGFARAWHDGWRDGLNDTPTL